MLNFFCSNIIERKTKIKLKILMENYVIISDMAADTTGNKSLDAIRTNQLCAEVIELSTHILKPDAVFVSKLFMGMMIL